jgi:hypothetical protein
VLTEIEVSQEISAEKQEEVVVLPAAVQELHAVVHIQLHVRASTAED